MNKAYYFKVQKLSIRASGIQAIKLIQCEMAMEPKEQEPLPKKRSPDGSAQLLIRSEGSVLSVPSYVLKGLKIKSDRIPIKIQFYSLGCDRYFGDFGH